MPYPWLGSHSPLRRTAEGLALRSWPLLMVAAALAAGSRFVAGPVPAMVMATGAATVLAMLVLTRVLAWIGTLSLKEPSSLAKRFAAGDATPVFATDGYGRVIYRNAAAVARFPAMPEQTLVRALGELFASPSAVIYRLQSRAEADGSAREDVVTRRGHVRVSVHRFAARAFFWRFDEMADRNAGHGADSLSLPVVSVGRSETILFMNEAARRLLGSGVRTLGDVLHRGPVRNGAAVELDGPDGPVVARVLELKGHDGRREFYFLPVSDELEDPIEGGIFDSLPVALLKLRPDGRVLLANRLARDLLAKSEPVPNLQEVVEGLGRPVLDWLQEAARGGAGRKAEVLRVRRDDKEVFLRVSLRRVVEDGQVCLLAVLTDATELKSLEAQFVQSQKMQAIGQLAGGIAHDFNNLLTAISGHCDLLLLRHDQGDPDYGDLMQINQNANRAAGLVRQLLAFSRKQTLRPEVLDLRDILTDLTHLLNRLVGERVSLTVSHASKLSNIRADRRQLEQVIMNLVVNARDAVAGSGEIRIETAMQSLKTELQRDRATVPPGDYVLIRVIDEGSGIAPDKLNKIFEPFYTTKGVGEGTGLGLSTVYGIVKQSGGFIFVDSAVGSGTSFTLYFPSLTDSPDMWEPADDAMLPDLVDVTGTFPSPRALPAPAANEVSTNHDANTRDDCPATRGEGVVLLVEDEAPVRAFASRALRMRGFTVLEAGNAEQALDMLKNPEIQVDVFVTDVVMPGLDGPSWVRQALKKRPDTRVVFVSGYSEESLSETRDRIPNSVFLPKPFTLLDLTATVRDQIR